MKILFAEDDTVLGQKVRQSLQQENYIVDWYQDGVLAEAAYRTGNYDLFILDVNLPRKSGFSIIDDNADSIRTIPIIFVSSLSECVKGLNKGADDYITKPFQFSELKARILSVIRRHKHLTSLVIEYRDLKMNLDDHQVYFRNQMMRIAYKEFLLLKMLMLNQGRVLTKEQIIEKISSADHYTESNVLEAHIYNLRKIIGKDYIRTVRSVGYTMDPIIN